MTTYHHVMELLREEESRPAVLGVPALWLTAVRHAWLLPFVKARLLRRVRANTHELEDMSLRLGGFAHRYQRAIETVDCAREEAAVRLCLRVEDHMMVVRAQVLEMIQLVKPLASDLPDLWKALVDWNTAAADLWESAQDLRWVVMEFQAQQDIDQGRVQAFATAADAIASLRQ